MPNNESKVVCSVDFKVDVSFRNNVVFVEGVTAGSGTETGFPCQLLVSILGGLVIVLAVSLVAIVYKTLR